jgi:hypothetical protein
MPTRAREYDLITDTVSSLVPVPRRQVALVSWDGRAVHGLALMTRARSTLSFKTNFRLTDFHDVPVSDLDTLESALSQGHRSSFASARDGGGSLSAAIAAELKSLFEGEEQEAWVMLEALAAATPAELWPADRDPVVAYEREAVGLALSAAGLERAPVMKSWDGNAEAPFLSSLAAFHLLEDTIIAHDARVFGDWSVVAGGLVGATRFEQQGRKLTVINVNRSKIEQTLGCDLIYYTHRYQAYVLVQYKRLRNSGQTWEYRPDQQLAKELERMRIVTSQSKPSSEPSEHRLGEDFCFLKLCRPEVEDPFSLEMAEGIYLPLGLWDKLESSGQLSGPRGGTVLTYDNVERYLTNTNMIALIERSWIGSCGPTSEQIGEVIERALEAGNSVILAADYDQRPPPRHRRPRR